MSKKSVFSNPYENLGIGTLLDSMMLTRDALVSGKQLPHRRDVFNDNLEGGEVDTVCAHDTHEWETGIKRDYWTIVEQYRSREEAEKGHAKWVAALTADPALELIDCFADALGEYDDDDA